MFQLYRRLKWVYQKFKLSTWVPFAALVSYTIFGAFVFKSFEMENDQRIRQRYKNRTHYAMDQVVERMLEVRCHDQELRVADKKYQVQHAREALIWFLEHLNLSEVINERGGDTPWTWLGSMFYAGQLYTTIGYGYPTANTTAGRVTSIFYILFGIPIFLIILKDIGRLMSRTFRKLYKKLRGSRQKIVESAPIRLISRPFTSANKSDAHNGKNGHQHHKETDLEAERQNKVNAQLHAQNAFPIPIALAMLFLWILLSAGLFCLWEDEWGYLTSVYFFFVSISTVGLGDIVFSNPKMMIIYFLLILIGLALLSMCFNLIQAALERLLDRLLEEYIEEIEKMAEIVAQDEYLDEEVGPLEFRMTGNLLALPMKKVTKDTGFLAEAKEWMASRIANNLLASRLGPRGDSESEEEEEPERPAAEEPPRLKVSTVSSYQPRDLRSSISSRAPSIDSVRSTRPLVNLGRFQFRHGRPMFNTVRTLEKMKPHKGDFRSLLFSKFVQSDRLNRIVDDSAPPPKRMVTSSCQTDELPRKKRHHHHHQHHHQHQREASTSSSSVSPNRSIVFDDESLMSAAYCDLRFDYSQDMAAVSRQHSSFSVLRMEDEEPLLPSKAALPIWFTPGRPPPKLQLQQLSSVTELPSPLSVEVFLRKRSSCSSLRGAPVVQTPVEEPYERIRSVCGLLPSDFDSRSNSSRSTMVDSGYDKSHHEDAQRDVQKEARPLASPSLAKMDTVEP